MSSDIGLLAIFGLFGFTCFFFILISVFYHQKSGQGVSPFYFYLCSTFFFLGQILRLGFMPKIATQFIGPISVIAGGLGLSLISIALYRNMMSVRKPDK